MREYEEYGSEEYEEYGGESWMREAKNKEYEGDAKLDLTVFGDMVRPPKAAGKFLEFRTILMCIMDVLFEI